MKSILTQKVYSFVWGKHDMRRAEIVFEAIDVKRGDDTWGKEWQFLRCNFSGVEERYTIDDWQFLQELAEEIIMLNDTMNTVADMAEMPLRR
jgi:hypothetical protein